MADLAELLVRIDATTEQLRRELKRAETATQGTAQVIDREVVKVERTLNRMQASGGRAFGGMGLVMQQAGFQVGDFAVQVASGQGAMRAFVQQGSQMLGFFGPWGAVAGAALAVGGALATTFLDLGGSTDKAKDSTKSYAEALEMADELLRTSEENAKHAAAQKLEEAKKTLDNTLTIERENLARFERLKLRREEAAFDAGMAGAPGVTLDTSDLDAKIAEQERKIRELEDRRRRLDDPSQLGANRKKDERATRDLTSALDEYVARLQDEVFILRQSKDMRDIERAVMEAQNAAMKEGNLLTQEQIDLVRSLAEEKQRITEQDKAAEEARRKAEKEAADLLRENERAARDFANVIGTAFEDAVLEGEKLSDVLKALEKDIARIILRVFVTKPLESALSGIAGGLGKSLGGFFGGLFGSDPSGTFGGVGNGPAARASGGPVTASTPFLVGERGPELFVPHTSGTIVSNDNLSRMGGGPVFNIDARGASVEAVVRLERMVRALNGSIESRAVAAVTDSRRRGQALA